MPLFKVNIVIHKLVNRIEESFIPRMNDELRYIEIKKIDGFNIQFDLTVDCNDDNELGVVFNVHSDFHNWNNPINTLFDKNEYDVEVKESGMKVSISFLLVDKENHPFQNLVSKNRLGFYFKVEEYAKKTRLAVKNGKNRVKGAHFEDCTKNEWFEVFTDIYTTKKGY